MITPRDAWAFFAGLMVANATWAIMMTVFT